MKGDAIRGTCSEAFGRGRTNTFKCFQSSASGRSGGWAGRANGNRRDTHESGTTRHRRGVDKQAKLDHTSAICRQNISLEQSPTKIICHPTGRDFQSSFVCSHQQHGSKRTQSECTDRERSRGRMPRQLCLRDFWLQDCIANR